MSHRSQALIRSLLCPTCHCGPRCCAALEAGSSASGWRLRGRPQGSEGARRGPDLRVDMKSVWRGFSDGRLRCLHMHQIFKPAFKNSGRGTLHTGTLKITLHIHTYTLGHMNSNLKSNLNLYSSTWSFTNVLTHHTDYCPPLLVEAWAQSSQDEPKPQLQRPRWWDCRDHPSPRDPRKIPGEAYLRMEEERIDMGWMMVV